MPAKRKHFFYFDVGLNKAVEKPDAKAVNSRIRKRSFELAFSWKSRRNLIYGWILLFIISIMFTLIIHDWGAQIRPPGVKENVGVSISRLDSTRLEVMIISIEKDTDIEYLTYYTSNGSGYINKTANPVLPVRDIGDVGTIPVPGHNEKVEIFATLRNGTIKIYDKTE